MATGIAAIAASREECSENLCQRQISADEFTVIPGRRSVEERLGPQCGNDESRGTPLAKRTSHRHTVDAAAGTAQGGAADRNAMGVTAGEPRARKHDTDVRCVAVQHTYCTEHRT